MKEVTIVFSILSKSGSVMGTEDVEINVDGDDLDVIMSAHEEELKLTNRKQDAMIDTIDVFDNESGELYEIVDFYEVLNEQGVL